MGYGINYTGNGKGNGHEPPPAHALLQKLPDETDEEYGVRKQLGLVIEGDDRMVKIWEGVCTAGTKIRKKYRAFFMLVGDPGSGKDRLAMAHALNCGASGKEFIRINCAGISPSIAESELFGHDMGAFTDARKSKEGPFEAVGEGLVFLDEMGCLPAEVQNKVLTLSGDPYVFQRVGSHDPKTFMGNIVGAMTPDTYEKVPETLRGRFGWHANIPPLRNRAEPHRKLIVEALAANAHVLLMPDAREMLLEKTLTGNIRNIRMLLECVSARLLRKEEAVATSETIDWATQFVNAQTAEREREWEWELGGKIQTLEEIIHPLEREYFLFLYSRFNGNQVQMSKAAGVQRTTLKKRLVQHGIVPGKAKDGEEADREDDEAA